MSAAQVTLLIGAALGGGLVQGAAGFGFALAATPVALTLVSPRLAVATMTLLSSMALPATVINDRREVSISKVSLLVAASIPGLVVGLAVLLLASSDVIKLVAGASSLMAAAALASQPSTPFQRERLALGVAALVSGVLQGTSGLGGPPVVVVMLKQQWEANRVRGTIAAFFVLINGLFLGALALQGKLPVTTWSLSLRLAPMVVLGVALGRLIAARMTERARRQLNLTIVSISGSAAILTGVQQLGIW